MTFAKTLWPVSPGHLTFQAVAREVVPCREEPSKRMELPRSCYLCGSLPRVMVIGRDARQTAAQHPRSSFAAR